MPRWIKITGSIFLVITSSIIIVLRVLLWNSERNKKIAYDIPSIIGVGNNVYGNAYDYVREHVKGLVAECKIPGLTIAVARDSFIIWFEGFGYSDLKRKIKTNPGSVFRVASVSKSFTATGMMKLVQNGKLNMQAPIQHYVPEFPDKDYRITADLLASHRAGIRNYLDDSEAINTKHYENVIASLEKFKNDKLLFVPGTDFEYSNYGYVLLSAAMERASGKDFLSYMQDEIFLPLGMLSTRPDVANDSIINKTTFYDYVTPYSLNGETVVSPYNDLSCKWASGGFLSTAEDMARFGSSLIRGNRKSILKDQFLDSLFKPKTMRMRILGYGYGWMTARDPYLRRVYFHFGASSGGTSVLIIYPAEKITIAMVGNLGHAKFPYNRLMNIVNNFVSRPVLLFYNILALSAILYIIIKSINVFKKIKKKNHETSLV